MVTWGGLLGDRLVKNLSFIETDIEAKQLRIVSKARCDTLQILLSVGNEGSVGRKEKAPDQPILGFDAGL